MLSSGGHLRALDRERKPGLGWDRGGVALEIVGVRVARLDHRDLHGGRSSAPVRERSDQRGHRDGRIVTTTRLPNSVSARLHGPVAEWAAAPMWRVVIPDKTQVQAQSAGLMTSAISTERNDSGTWTMAA